MRRTSVILLLAASPAWAASWKSIGDDASGTYYADTTAIEKSGNTAKMWSLLDYKSYQRMVEVGYWSQKSHVEYDCGALRMRGLSVALHAEKLGEGKAIYEDTSPHDWEDVTDGTMGETLRKVACK
ncbi:MAG TPA: surface-adhesin E family protein [Burkholderiales bacterium]|nr:surface-adhesin E family protein [Burkholderiales bacterium]